MVNGEWKMANKKRIFLHLPFTVYHLPLFLVFLFSAAISAQVISGKVTDSNDAPIENAEVGLTNQTKTIAAAKTDADGKFSIDLQHTQNSLLLISAKGFTSFSKILPPNFDEFLNVVLETQTLRDEVTVSITNTETRLSETPASVVVLDRRTLNQTAAQTADDQLRQIAGFTLFRRSGSKTSNPTAQGANLRGISGSGAARTSVTLDGLSLNDAFGGWTFWSRVPEIAVEQVEVLRGGASVFYGDAALSGAVNLITSKAVENHSVLRFETSGGTQGTFDAGAFAAYAKSVWSFDLAAERFTTDGYIPVAEAERGAADTEADSRHDNIFLTVRRKFGANADAFLRGSYFTENRSNGTSLTYNQTRFRQLAAGANLTDEKFGAFQIRAFLETQIYDQTFSAVGADRNTETLSRIQRVPSQASGANLLWNRAFGKHFVSASFDFRRTRGFSDEIGFFGGRASSMTGAGGTERNFAVFAQDFWRATRKLNLSFSARFDDWKNFAAVSANKTPATNQINILDFPDRNESAFSPRVAAIYQISERFSLYAAYAGSFRAPTLNELYRGFRVGSVVTNASENLRAERADTFETGLDFNGFNRRLNLRGNFFDTRVTNPIVSVTLNTAPTLITRRRQNVGATRSRGLELDAEFAPRRNLRFSASYLFVDSRVAEFPASPDLINKFLPQIPPRQLNFQTFYRPLEKLSFSLQGRISAAQFEDDLNTLRLRPFFTLDAFAAYHLKKFEIFAAIENLFNNRYDIGLTPNLTVAAPRFVRVGLRFDLNSK